MKSGRCGDSAIYTLDDSGLLTIGGTGPMWNYGSTNGKEGEITYSPFQGNPDIKRVVVEEGVTSIGEMMFADCKRVESVDIAATVKEIGAWAFFHDIALAKAHMRDGLESIGLCAFDGCLPLGGVNIPDSVSAIGNYAFRNCLNIHHIEIPNKVPYISCGLFAGCHNLRTATLGAGVMYIGDYAFEGCYNLQDVVMPGGALLASRALLGTKSPTVHRYPTDRFKRMSAEIGEDRA